MIRRSRPIIWPFVLFSLFLFSCIEKELDFENIKTQNWNSEWAVPLINSTFTFNDFFSDTTDFVHEGEDGLITLVFESEELASETIGDIEIPDQIDVYDTVFSIPDEVFLIPPGEALPDDTISFPITFELSEPGLRIDSTRLKSGHYRFSFKTDLNWSEASVQVTLPNIVNFFTNDPLGFIVDIGNPNGMDITIDTLINMEDYSLVFEQSTAGQGAIIINAVVSIVTDDNNNNSPYFVNIENGFEDLEFVSLFGYVGFQERPMQDTIVLDVFSNNIGGNFVFADNSIRFDITAINSFGMPVTLDIVECKAVREGDDPASVDIYLFGEGNPNEIDINYPDIYQVGESVITEISSENSNIAEAMNISPDKIIFDIWGLLNPDADSTLTNFLLDTSMISAFIQVELDLFGAVNNFKVADTLELDLGETEEIKSLLFVVDIENGFPLNTFMQLEFVDSLYNVVHTLFPSDEQIMMAAPVGPAPGYRVAQPVRKLTQFEINEEAMQNVFMAKQIIFYATLSTSDEFVKIYSDYSLDLKLGVKAEIGF